MRVVFIFSIMFLFSYVSLYAQVKVVEASGKKGLVDHYDDFQIAPPLYESIKILEKQQIAIARNGKQIEVYKLSDNKPYLKFLSDEWPKYQEVYPLYNFFCYLKDGLIGLIAPDGQVRLPAQFQNIQARQQGLIIGYTKDTVGGTLLHVFDKDANKILEIEAEDLIESLDIPSVGSILRIRRADQSAQWVKISGQPYEFPHADHVVWSDGTVMICAVYENKYPYYGKNFGLLSWSGDTLLSCTHQEISYVMPNVFRWRSYVKRSGLCNSKGQDIISGGNAPFVIRNERFITYMSVGSPRRYNVFDLEGNPLWTNVNIEQFVEHPLSQSGRIADFSPQHYMIIVNVLTGKKSLYGSNGKLILPEEYRDFEYFSEQSPIITNSDYTYEAYWLDGSRALKDKYSGIEYTYNPKVLLARPEKQDKWGFIDLNKPDEAIFDIEYITKLKKSKYFIARKRNAWFLFDPGGHLLTKQPLATLLDPEYEATAYKEIFLSQGHGRLIAICHANDQQDGTDWIGLDENGVAWKLKGKPQEIIPDQGLKSAKPTQKQSSPGKVNFNKLNSKN